MTAALLIVTGLLLASLAALPAAEAPAKPAASNPNVTAPQCTPSRAGLISGQYQNKLGVGQNLNPMRIGSY